MGIDKFIQIVVMVALIVVFVALAIALLTPILTVAADGAAALLYRHEHGVDLHWLSGPHIAATFVGVLHPNLWTSIAELLGLIVAVLLTFIGVQFARRIAG